MSAVPYCGELFPTFPSSKFGSEDTNGNLRICRCQSTIQTCKTTSPRLRKVSFPTGSFFWKNLRFRWLTGRKQGYLSHRKSWISAANSAISERRKPPKVLKPRFRVSGFGETEQWSKSYVGQTPDCRKPEMVTWHLCKTLL
jgi:hypothetical protein